jgi:hypothetical protein
MGGHPIRITNVNLGRIARGGHGLPKISLVLPCLLRPAGGPPQKQPNGRFRGGPLTGWAAVAIFYPIAHPVPYASVLDRPPNRGIHLGYAGELRVPFLLNSMIRGTMLKNTITNK